MPYDAKKQKKKRGLLGLLLFMPLVRLRGSVSDAADSIEESFDAMYDAYESEASVAGALTKGRGALVSALETLILSGLNRGYKDGSKITGAEELDFGDLAKHQANKTSQQMLKSTRGWMKNNGTDGFTLSRDRADRAARYTGAEAYFNGLALAFKDSDGEYEKAWETTSDDPCEDICLENEDEGFIPMEDEFQSGHYAPLGHPSCQCYLKVRRAQG